MTTQTIKIWKKTVKNLKFIHAETGESMVKILDRLIAAELKGIKTIRITDE